jgi:ABC-type lipoprotein export system ATPase subunit
MPDPLVVMKDIGRSYASGTTSVVALVSVTRNIQPGDKIAIIGPSGCGKSTLLHIIAGLDSPTMGEISWPGMGEKQNLRPVNVGVVFQMPSLSSPLNAVENVEMPLLLTGINAEEARKRAMDMLDRIGLSEIAEKLPEELSGGQAQRISMARAIVCRPKLILADEPTGQLDHPTSQHLMNILLDFVDETGAALVVATHDPAIAGRMETIWRMSYGLIEANQ